MKEAATMEAAMEAAMAKVDCRLLEDGSLP